MGERAPSAITRGQAGACIAACAIAQHVHSTCARSERVPHGRARAAVELTLPRALRMQGVWGCILSASYALCTCRIRDGAAATAARRCSRKAAATPPTPPRTPWPRPSGRAPGRGSARRSRIGSQCRARPPAQGAELGASRPLAAPARPRSPRHRTVATRCVLDRPCSSCTLPIIQVAAIGPRIRHLRILPTDGIPMHAFPASRASCRASTVGSCYRARP